jgi:hypothetical protein
MTDEVTSLKKVKSRAVNVIYGAITALSLLLALDYGTLTSSRTMAIVVVTLGGVWFARSYANVIGGELAMGGPAKFAENIRVFKETIWVLAPSIPILGMFTLSAVGIISLKGAISLAVDHHRIPLYDGVLVTQSGRREFS